MNAHLSLVSKICTELENHVCVNEKDLAEFIIYFAEKNDTFETIKNALVKTGAEFSDSCIANLLRIIQDMEPKRQKESSPQSQNEEDWLAEMFSGQATPNDPKCEATVDEDEEEAIEIELVELEPPFLQGYGHMLRGFSPVIIKDPDGPMARTAAFHRALARAHRELWMHQGEQVNGSIPTGFNQNWIDPFAEAYGRNLAANRHGI
jgi:hypothetical protein